MPEQRVWTPQQRLAEFYRRLRAAPRMATAADAFRVLCETLDQVEEELSGVPKQSPPPLATLSDGRMYCPLEDHIQRRDDGSIFATTRGHQIEVQADGTICIVNRFDHSVEFQS